MAVVKHTLPNGVRVLVEPVSHVGSASIGLWCRTGSADENESEAGLTHFIEHMLFKGTSKRTAKQIAEDVEGRGGMLNAFTDKEQTCYYCRVLAAEAEPSIDVLTDMMTGSLLDQEEIDRERGVILEEINRGEDEPGDHVHDLHLQGLWPDHRLGLSVIGTRESVSSFNRVDFVGYMERQYRAENVLLAVAGNVSPEDAVRWAEARLGHLPAGATKSPMPRPEPKPGENLVGKDVEQVHFCIGTEGVSVYDEEIYVAAVLDGILGSGMSSRLFQEVRERRGLAYAIGSYGLSYTCGGAFTIYGGTGVATWPEVQSVVRAELDTVMRDGPTEDEVARVKRNLAGTLALSLEGMSPRMMRMARNEFVHGREVPLDETLRRIESVTAGQVTELARRTLGAERMRTTAIGPFDRAA